ncbi:MAG: MBL fold metallo-hydrolase [Gemmatimonadota bacterium]
MSRLLTVDTLHDGRPGAIAAYLWSGTEPVLVDPGPASVLPRLREALAAAGLPLDEVRHVALTHVHLDHAGAAGHLAAADPRIRIHVHEAGAPHLAAPERLVASTRRTFGDAHDRLWGEVLPVPADQLRAWRPGSTDGPPGLRAVPTPGHIDHHLAWLDESDGLLFSGDSLGIILGEGVPVHPIGPERAAVTHFGVHSEVESRTRELREALLSLAARIGDALAEGRTSVDAEEFDQEARERLARVLPRDRVDAYLDVFSASNDYRGLQRYLERNPDWRDKA